MLGCPSEPVPLASVSLPVRGHASCRRHQCVLRLGAEGKSRYVNERRRRSARPRQRSVARRFTLRCERSAVSCAVRVADPASFTEAITGSGGREDECTGLENRRPSRVRGFESLPLRKIGSRTVQHRPGPMTMIQDRCSHRRPDDSDPPSANSPLLSRRCSRTRATDRTDWCQRCTVRGPVTRSSKPAA